jgi:hypothetical protein
MTDSSQDARRVALDSPHVGKRIRHLPQEPTTDHITRAPQSTTQHRATRTTDHHAAPGHTELRSTQLLLLLTTLEARTDLAEALDAFGKRRVRAKHSVDDAGLRGVRNPHVRHG